MVYATSKFDVEKVIILAKGYLLKIVLFDFKCNWPIKPNQLIISKTIEKRKKLHNRQHEQCIQPNVTR